MSASQPRGHEAVRAWLVVQLGRESCLVILEQPTELACAPVAPQRLTGGLTGLPTAAGQCYALIPTRGDGLDTNESSSILV
jgi:hypothetical protein